MAMPLQFEKAPGVSQSFAVRHYTVAEVAQLWNISEMTARRLFEREPETLEHAKQCYLADAVARKLTEPTVHKCTLLLRRPDGEKGTPDVHGRREDLN